MKKENWILLVIIVSLFILFSLIIISMNQRIQKLSIQNEQVIELEEDIQELDQLIDDLNQRIGELEEEVGNLKEDLEEENTTTSTTQDKYVKFMGNYYLTRIEYEKIEKEN